METRLQFSRFEFKYVLPDASALELERDLGHFVEVDPHALAGAKQDYFVRSLYFDNPVFRAYHEKIDGLRTRSKFRLRTYARSSDEDAPLFLEIKGRHDNLVFKQRTPVRKPSTPLEGAALIDWIERSAAPGELRDRFSIARSKDGLRPVAVVDYRRRPYVTPFDPDFRITFDRMLVGAASSALHPGLDQRRRELKPGWTVVEVKFRRHIPAWFHRLIQAHNLRRRSISKICTAMEALGLASELA